MHATSDATTDAIIADCPHTNATTNAKCEALPFVAPSDCGSDAKSGAIDARQKCNRPSFFSFIAHAVALVWFGNDQWCVACVALVCFALCKKKYQLEHIIETAGGSLLE